MPEARANTCPGASSTDHFYLGSLAAVLPEYIHEMVHRDVVNLEDFCGFLVVVETFAHTDKSRTD